jgi:hypothetical protein
MSQAGIVDFEGSHPQVPTLFVANVGSAVPIANTLEILGTAVSAHSIPLETIGSGNTITIEAQYTSASGSSSANNAGLASFNSTYFNVDANGFVTLNGSSMGETITGNTGGALSPVAGNWNILGTSTAAGTTPVQTSGSGNTLTVQVQKSQAIASTNASNVGLAAFNSTYFTVDANGFVSLVAASLVESLVVDTFTAPGTNPVLSNSSGQIGITGGQVAAGTTTNVIRTDSLAANTYTIQIQRSQAVASSTVGDNGVSHFNSTYFTVDANGFVSLNGSGVGETITGNTGGALSPTSGNWNILGSGSITTSGSVSTLTVQLTGLTNHAIQVGAGTATLTQVGPSATSGQLFQSKGSTTDPAFTTSTYPSTNATGDIVYGSTTNVLSTLAIGSTGNVLQVVGGLPAWAPPATGGTVTSVSGTANQVAVANGTTTPVISLIGPYTPATYTAHGVLIGEGTSSIVATTAGSAGQHLQSGGGAADPNWTTATFPSTATGTGTILRADGTNWSATTTTYPNTNAINTIMYASSANILGSITAANNGVLISGTTGVPSWLGAGTTGQILTATTGSPPSWASPSASAITITGDSGGALSGSAFTFTGGTTGLTFAGAGTTETLGGILALANGGTNANLTASNGGIFYSTATAGAILAGTATAGQMLQSGASTIPSWSTSTYPSTNAINTLLYASSANVMSALSTANNGVLTTNSSGVPAITALGNNQFIATNSAGTPAARSFSVVRQVFTSSGTYTPTTGMLYCDIEVVGGGGGSGGVSATSATTISASGGGAGGGYARKLVSAATIGASQTVTIGAGGTAGSAGANTGGTGGITSVGAIVLATGGGGGAGTAAGSAISNANINSAAGGTGSGGDFNTTGGMGGCPFGFYLAGIGSPIINGQGGTTFFGGNYYGSTASYGAGALGRTSYAGTVASVGLAGFKGIVIITEFIIN